MEQQLTAGLGERQISKFVEYHEVLSTEIFGQPTLPASSSLRLKLVDEIDDIEEPATRPIADASACNRDGKMRFPGTGSTDQHQIALMREEVATSKVAHEWFIDRRVAKPELLEILGQWQLGDGDLVTN